MNTIDVLKAEAIRLKYQLDKVEECIRALEGTAGISPTLVTTNGAHRVNSSGEYDGMTQREAIRKAIKEHGPQTTRQLFDRLTAGGMHIRQPSYITALLPRFKKEMERRDDGRVHLRPMIAV